jgi:GxxExxY protein
VLLDNERVNKTTHAILSAAIEVHRTLGPGLLESIYLEALQYELQWRDIRFVAERRIPVTYKTVPLHAHCRIDLIVEELIVVELKAVEALLPVHQSQVLTYLKMTESPAGLLINFNVPRLMDGVRRLVNPSTVNQQ